MQQTQPYTPLAVYFRSELEGNRHRAMLGNRTNKRRAWGGHAIFIHPSQSVVSPCCSRSLIKHTARPMHPPPAGRGLLPANRALPPPRRRVPIASRVSMRRALWHRPPPDDPRPLGRGSRSFDCTRTFGAKLTASRWTCVASTACSASGSRH